ncbi:MAG: hypothetical protein AAB444_03070 [Patescibacteria group bacterium]
MQSQLSFTLGQKIKNILWRVFYPVFRWQKFFLNSGILFWHTPIRQRFFLGWLAPGKTLEELRQHLSEQGFGNHFVAWLDKDQALSWRKLDGFDYQYHLRVYTDGEIRGHYEYTPESRPMDHFREVGEENRREVFLKFLGKCIVQKKHTTNLPLDRGAEGEPQFTISAALKQGR